MDLNKLAKLKESYMKGHHVYQDEFVVGAVFDCNKKRQSNPQSEWAMV